MALPHLQERLARMAGGCRAAAGPAAVHCFAAVRASRRFACFAIGLIAAKPVKPCDGGVFGALNLLLKKEQSAPAPIGVWLALSSLGGHTLNRFRQIQFA